MVTAPDDLPEWQAMHKPPLSMMSGVDKAKADFIYDYAVEAWQNGTGEWQTEAPPDWTFPDVLSRHGILPWRAASRLCALSFAHYQRGCYH